MPLLEQGTSTEAADGRKYVYWNKEIYFANDFEEGDQHGDLVRSAAKAMGIGIGEIQRDSNGRPMVEAAGKIAIVNDKFDFGVSTTTCNVIYSATEALKNVKARAREIVGPENVN